MPIKNETLSMEYGINSFGTYGSQGTQNYTVMKQIIRTRSWSNTSYRTSKQRAQRILSAGYLPTQAYSDDLQHVINSKQLVVTGQMNSDPGSIFIWKDIPVINRINVTLSDSGLASMRASALEKLQSRLSGQGVNVPVTIAEAGKTATMIGDAATNLFKAYQDVRHGRFGRAASRLGITTPKGVKRSKGVAGNWMEYRYGWRLTVMDITSYLKTIHNMLTTKPIVYREQVVLGSTSRSTTKSTNQNYGTASRPAIINYTRVRRTSIIRHVSVGYVYSLENVALSTGQQLGLLNLPLVAWELVPGSFMLDWSLNVGSVLEGLTAFQGKKFLDGWSCLAMESNLEELWTDLKKGSSMYRVDPTAFASPVVIERRFARSILSGFQASSLRLDFSANFKHAIDGMALMSQIFRK